MLSVRIRKRLVEDSREGFDLDVEFEAPAGVTILFGPSGSGKTVTLKSIAGIIAPDFGSIRIDDEVLFDSESRVSLPIRRRGAGYVFQHLSLFPHLSVRDNVEFGMKSLPARARHERALKAMTSLRIEKLGHRKPRDISGGEAQRVALARALSSGPRMLLLDEPLSAIDEATKLEIISDLKSINRELQLPIVYVTHSREEAITLGARVVVYERGRIVTVGYPLEVFGAPVSSSLARLPGVDNVFEGRIIARDSEQGTMSVMIDDVSGGGQDRAKVEIPYGPEAVGERVKVAIPSGDILLAIEEPRNTSARNILRGRVTRIEDRGDRVLVSVKSDVTWRVRITRQALRELRLEPGREVWLAFKTHSCHVLDR